MDASPRRHWVAIAALLFFTVHAHAAEVDGSRGTDQILLGDPFRTELVFPQQKGETELTFLPGFIRERDRDVFRLPIRMEYGLSDAWEAELEFETWVHSKPKHKEARDGIGNLEVGTRYSFLNIGGSDYHAAFGFEMEIPTGSVSKELSEGLIEYEPFMVMGRDCPFLNDLHVYSQFGLSFAQRVRSASENDQEEDDDTELLWGAGLLYPLDHFVVDCELNWQNTLNSDEREESAWTLTPGLTWRFAPTWETAIGVPVGLNDKAERWGLLLRMTTEF